MLYYGHSGMSKGIDYLVEAIPEILQGNPDGVLIFNLIPAKRDREIREKIIRYSEAVVAYPPDKGCRDALIKRPNPMEGGLSTKKSPLPHFPAVLTGHSMKGGVYIFDEQPQVVLRELVATADIVIAPSLAEGFGSVHSETCAMGKVLLTTQVAAIPEVVSGQVKFISPSSREAIVQGIKEIREGNIESIPSKTFNREESVEKIEQLYQP
ncbi:MAG: glycosyltransferase family 4 protein [Candidatus Peribacteria bacterium]|jgi:glycosyltransferase involved in cell wall biosynthesis|nr:glycosyltransferase family 4 protein [Candidatus Peribacteria bacterium]